jgi:hypothetical protein
MVPPSGLTPGWGTGGENDELISEGGGGKGVIGPPGGGGSGDATATGAAIPRMGPAIGATPTIVPLRRFEPPWGAWPGGGAAPGPGCAGAPGRCPGLAPAGAAGAAAPVWFIMSMVPLNLGAATLLR